MRDGPNGITDEQIRQMTLRRWSQVAAGLEPADWQERHSATEAVEVRISQNRVTTRCRRRKIDARMWEAMSPRQERAADAIFAGFGVLVNGARIKTQSLIRVDRGTASQADASDYEAVLIRRYVEWADRATAEGLSASDVVQVLVHGESCAQQDRRLRQGNGKALLHLLEALDLYAVMCRWG